MICRAVFMLKTGGTVRHEKTCPAFPGCHSCRGYATGKYWSYWFTKVSHRFWAGCRRAAKRSNYYPLACDMNNWCVGSTAKCATGKRGPEENPTLPIPVSGTLNGMGHSFFRLWTKPTDKLWLGKDGHASLAKSRSD